MRRWGLLLFAAFAASCAPSLQPGECRVNADCVAGKCIGASASAPGTCADSVPCSVACGDGLACVQEAGAAPSCVLTNGSTLTAAVGGPSLVGASGGTFTCGSSGIAVSRASLHVVSGAATSDVALAADANGWAGAWVPPDGFPGGAASVTCVVEAGPAEAALKVSSSALAVTVDLEGPAVDAEVVSGWFGPRKPVALSGDVSDASGVTRVFARHGEDVSELVVAGGRFSGAFEIADRFAPGTQGAATLDVVAVDGAGNETAVEVAIQVDVVPPEPVLTGSVGWTLRGSSNWTASVVGSGAPLAATGHTLVPEGDSGVVVEGMLTSGTVQFVVDTRAFTASGFEGTVGLTATVVDEAGNEGRATAAVRVDDAAPVFVFENADETFAIGPTARMRVRLDEAGSGLGLGPVELRVAGRLVTCAAGTDGLYRCDVSTSGESVETTSWEWRATTRDQLGNTALSIGRLKLDGQGPVFSFGADDTLSGPATSVTIDVEVVDAGVGVDPTTPPTLQFDGGSSMSGVRVSGTTFRFGPAPGSAFIGTSRPPGTYLIASHLRAQDVFGHVSFTDGPVRRFDLRPPSVTVQAVRFPATPVASGKLLRREYDPFYLSGSPSTPRRDRLQFDVLFADPTEEVIGGGAVATGIDAAHVRLAYVRRDGSTAAVVPIRVQDTDATFEFDANDVLVDGLETDLEEKLVGLTVRVPDLGGNVGVSRDIVVPVTREAVVMNVLSTAGGPLPLTGAGALTTDTFWINVARAPPGGNVSRRRVDDGSTSGNHATVPGTPQGSPMVGASDVWVVSRDAATTYVSAFPRNLPSGTSPTPTFTCTSARRPVGTPALANLRWDSTVQETALVPLENGRILLVRGGSTSCVSVELLNFSPHDLAGTALATAGESLFVPLRSGLLGFATVFPTAPSPSSVTTLPGNTTDAPGVALNASNALYFSGAQLVVTDRSAGNAVGGAVPGVSAGLVVPPVLTGASEALVFPGTSFVRVGLDRTVAASRTIAFNGAHPVAPPLVADSPEGLRIYVVYDSTHLAELDAQGRVRWSRMLGSVASGSPRMGCDGQLFVTTTGGKLHIFVTDATRLAATPWPTFQHDQRNTGNVATPLDECGP